MASYPEESPSSKPGGARRPGELPSKRAKARATTFMFVALVAGVTASWLITRHLARRNALANAPVSRIAVASMDIPRGSSLRAESISFVEWPAASLPQGAHTAVSTLENRVAGRDIAKGDPLVESRLAPPGTGVGMAAVLPANMRAMAVKVNEVIGVAGFIHPDDYVDVITTMTAKVKGQDEEIRSKIVLQNVKVVAIGQEMVVQNSKPVKVPVVTLLVDPEQSERLALATTEGKVQLTLRSRADETQIATNGITPPELFAKEKEDGKAVAKADKRPAAASPAPAPKLTSEVVEVLRGDRYEERKLRAKENE